MACDIVVAAEGASFGMPEAAIGMVPGFGVLRGPAVLGRHWTKYLVFSGGQLTAQEAFQLGLVQRVVPDADLVVAGRASRVRIGTVVVVSPLLHPVGRGQGAHQHGARRIWSGTDAAR